MDENGKIHVLRNDYAAITTIENPTAETPILATTFIEGINSVLPALKHYRPATITIDSEGSIWTHASQMAFKLMDEDLSKEYRVPFVVANEQLLEPLEFEMYPNPSTGQVTIKSAVIIQRVVIVTSTGQLVLTKSNTKELNMHLAAGMYLVKVITAKGIGVQKLIIE